MNIKEFPAGILKQFRLALLENIDIRPYIKEGCSEEQLPDGHIVVNRIN